MLGSEMLTAPNGRVGAHWEMNYRIESITTTMKTNDPTRKVLKPTHQSNEWYAKAHKYISNFEAKPYMLIVPFSCRTTHV